MISAGAPTAEIENQAQARSFRSLFQEVLEQCAQSEVSLEIALHSKRKRSMDRALLRVISATLPIIRGPITIARGAADPPKQCVSGLGLSEKSHRA